MVGGLSQARCPGCRGAGVPDPEQVAWTGSGSPIASHFPAYMPVPVSASGRPVPDRGRCRSRSSRSATTRTSFEFHGRGRLDRARHAPARPSGGRTPPVTGDGFSAWQKHLTRKRSRCPHQSGAIPSHDRRQAPRLRPDRVPCPLQRRGRRLRRPQLNTAASGRRPERDAAEGAVAGLRQALGERRQDRVGLLAQGPGRGGCRWRSASWGFVTAHAGD